MTEIPGHVLPSFSTEALDNALFHYTTAQGLVGIFETNEVWSTAPYCTNDESELSAGKGVLTQLFRNATYKLVKDRDSRVSTFYGRGVDVMDYADNFEQLIASMANSVLSIFITCFCKPTDKEVFYHGLLSQWRAYGRDGGYALHFNRQKLLAAMQKAYRSHNSAYDLQDVQYALDNPLKRKLLEHSGAFTQAYLAHLDDLAKPLDLSKMSMRSPIASLPGGPLEAFLEYLVHTKSIHFSEERECRLSLLQPSVPNDSGLAVRFFNREGLLVPYTKTPVESFNALDCIEWIIVGPGPRMGARFKSACQLAACSGRDIKVRPSRIPFTRL